MYCCKVPLSSRSRVMLSSQRLWPRLWSSCVAFIVIVSTLSKARYRSSRDTLMSMPFRTGIEMPITTTSGSRRAVRFEESSDECQEVLVVIGQQYANGFHRFLLPGFGKGEQARNHGPPGRHGGPSVGVGWGD